MRSTCSPRRSKTCWQMESRRNVRSGRMRLLKYYDQPEYTAWLRATPLVFVVGCLGLYTGMKIWPGARAAWTDYCLPLFWIGFGVIAILGSSAMLIAMLRSMRPPSDPIREAWICRKCEYDLRGNFDAAACPECGTPFNPNMARAALNTTHHEKR